MAYSEVTCYFMRYTSKVSEYFTNVIAFVEFLKYVINVSYFQ